MPAKPFAGSRESLSRNVFMPRRLEDWAKTYAPFPGLPDEFMDAQKTITPHWRKFLSALARLGPDEMSQRFAAADRRIREMGISYRVYGETGERTWPLSRLPLLISETEWQEISAGICQRAALLEHILSDLYGDARLVSEGALPAAVLAGSPEYIRAMKGVTPRGGRWLGLYAADLGRGPDGQWWVLSDRTQAPSGLGYALENRLITSQAFPNLYREMNIERLAPFFRAFRDMLTSAAPRPEPRICLLTPGPYSETYFEHSYLARYLGFLLVEGEDLVMKEAKLHVRTIAGLKRADVLWRRVDTDWCDPLELNAGSHLGVPGMLDALREKNVVVTNMPGTGVLESRALMGFMPRLCRHIFQEDLRMPNIATWWCGQEAERNHVLSSFENLALSAAFGDRVYGLPGSGPVAGSQLDRSAQVKLDQMIRERGIDYVGQEIVHLSTTPVLENGHLVPRPFVLRVFAAATPDGWCVLPGGFCRISKRSDARAISMDEGVQSADVWVLGNKPVEMTTLLPAQERVKIVRLLGNLPSRAADNLFWLGRYLERGEATLRLIRCLCQRVLDVEASFSLAARQSIEKLQKLLVAWGALKPESLNLSPAELITETLQEENNYGSAYSLAHAARRAASVIRERLSQDAWQLIGHLEQCIGRKGSYFLSESQALEHLEQALATVAGLSGLVQENMNRVAGWSFLDMGRRMERAINTCRFTRHFADREATVEKLDILLDLIDSQITYRSRYISGVALAPVRDMSILDPYNPRSVAFQIKHIQNHLSLLPVLKQDGMLEPPQRLATRLLAEVTLEEAEHLDTQKILDIEHRTTSLAEAIAMRYFLQNSTSSSEKMALPL